MEKIVTKELGEEDYEAVMKIRKPGDIYNGFDYLPAYYPVLIKTPGYKAFGAFVDKKLVAFTFAVYVDDGKTFISKAARVSKEFERKRVISTLHRYITTQLLPGVEQHAFVFSNVVVNARQSIADGIAKLIFKKVLYVYKARQEILEERIKNVVIPASVEILTQSDLSDLMDSTDICRYLFPEDRIFVDHMPYRLHKSNIPLIMLHHCIIVGTNVNDQKCNVKQRLLTFGNYVVCHSGLLYNLDVYGQNLKELRSHLLIHLGRLRSFTNTNVQLEIICSETIDKVIFDETMIQFGFQKITFFRSHLECAEISHKDSIPSYLNSKSTNDNSKAKL